MILFLSGLHYFKKSLIKSFQSKDDSYLMRIC